jgi:hypothetical protein
MKPARFSAWRDVMLPLYAVAGTIVLGSIAFGYSPVYWFYPMAAVLLVTIALGVRDQLRDSRATRPDRHNGARHTSTL